MPFARKNDPLTSHEAAWSVRNLTQTQRVILGLLVQPKTDEELIASYRNLSWAGRAPMASESGIRSRRHELVEQGLVESVGLGKTVFGRSATVWAIKGEQE